MNDALDAMSQYERETLAEMATAFLYCWRKASVANSSHRGAPLMAPIDWMKSESETLELLKAMNELRQLRFENTWLRDANKHLLQEVRRLRDALPPESTV